MFYLLKAAGGREDSGGRECQVECGETTAGSAETAGFRRILPHANVVHVRLLHHRRPVLIVFHGPCFLDVTVHVSWMLLCMFPGCYCACFLDVTVHVSWMLLCMFPGCYLHVTVHVSWMLLCMFPGCYCACFLDVTVHVSWMLLCMFPGCYCACFLDVTVHVSWMLLCMFPGCYCACFLDVTVHVSWTLLCMFLSFSNTFCCWVQNAHVEHSIYHIQHNKRSLFDKNWAMKKCQANCSYKHT